MPKPNSKRKNESESESDSDSGPDDRGPVKKQKSAPAKKTSSGSGKGSSGSGDENSWDLGKNRFVKLSEFKGKWYVNIREFYMDKSSAELKPGKKGIMLTMEQWQKFKGVMDELDDAIKQNV